MSCYLPLEKAAAFLIALPEHPLHPKCQEDHKKKQKTNRVSNKNPNNKRIELLAVWQIKQKIKAGGEEKKKPWDSVSLCQNTAVWTMKQSS